MKDCEFQKNDIGTYTCIHCGLTVPIKDAKANCKKFMPNNLHRNEAIINNQPSLIQKVVNFIPAAIKHAIAGSPTVPIEVVKERLAICRECPLFKPNSNQVGGVCTHSSCGCNIQDNFDYMNKIAWADQECPIKRWGKFIEKNNNEGV